MKCAINTNLQFYIRFCENYLIADIPLIYFDPISAILPIFVLSLFESFSH